MTTPTRYWTALVGVVVLLSLSGCGLPEDSQPRPIADDVIADLSGGEAGNTAVAPVSGEEWIVYVVETDPSADPETGAQRLHRFPVTGQGVASPPDLVEQLLLTRSQALNDSPTLSNQIPADTRLVDYRINEAGDTAILTLSPDFGGVQGEPLKLAVAQLVYTATEAGPITQVQFRVGEKFEDSQPIDVPDRDNEARTTVDRTVYEDLQPELPD